jgi:hypothetical protein
MVEDLLTRIQRELQERIEELHVAVEERDRLQADLRALEDGLEASLDDEAPVALDVASELPTASEQSEALDVESGPPATPEAVLEPSPDTEPPANVVRLPARRPLSRTRMVSPKVARLMHAPRRPALERAGVVRVGAGRVSSAPEDDLWPQDAGEEVDADAEVYERAI